MSAGTMLLALALAFAQEPAAAPRAVALEREGRPRLALVLVVDQLIPEQVPRLLPVLDGGLATLWNEGLVLESAALAHGLSFTAPGHVSAGTGVVPRRHGVVANGWIDAERKRSVYCCEDDDVRRVDGDGVHEDARDQRRSPVLCRVDGIADFVREAFPGARTISISGKDRAAIGLAGRHPDLALWWDKSRGAGFVTSTWYARELPGFVRSWNEGWLAEASGAKWDLSFEGERERLFELGTAANDREGEYRALGGGRTLPYTLLAVDPADEKGPTPAKLAEQVYVTPWMDRFVLELAGRAIVELELGADDVPDVLCLSLSAVDTAGHLFGPLSLEVTDVLLRLDRELGALFALLDERLGRERWVLGFTSDHGVLELPEELVARGIAAGRRTTREVQASLTPARNALVERFGLDPFHRQDSSGVIFDRAAVRAAKLDLPEVRAAFRDELLAASSEFWAHAWTFDEVERAAAVLFDGAEGEAPRDELPEDELLHLLAASFDAERSPDLFLVGPERVLLGEVGGTTHGTPYLYDRRIPLTFLGAGITHEVRTAPGSASIDLVPTLLDALGIDAGRPLDGVSRLR